MVLLVSPGAKVSVPDDGLVVAAGRGGVVAGGVGDGDRLGAGGGQVTVKVAATVPVFPSVTVTSLIRSDGGSGRPVPRVQQHGDALA